MRINYILNQLMNCHGVSLFGSIIAVFQHQGTTSAETIFLYSI